MLLVKVSALMDIQDAATTSIVAAECYYCTCIGEHMMMHLRASATGYVLHRLGLTQARQRGDRVYI
jgi:hypothetical protein